MPSFTDKAVAAELTAKMLLEVEAVHLRPAEPFRLTSGRMSPVYIDCRKLISFPRVRGALMDFAVSTILRDIGFEQLDAVAGGETAGIPFAAWIADRLGVPMQYIRKKPKGFGRGAQIEGELVDGARTLLVEDLSTDGGSKVTFAQAMRTAGLRVDHAFVIFNYGIFPQSAQIFSDAGLTLHALATWRDVLAVARDSGRFAPGAIAEIEAFLEDPIGWSNRNGGTEPGTAAV